MFRNLALATAFAVVASCSAQSETPTCADLERDVTATKSEADLLEAEIDTLKSVAAGGLGGGCDEQCQFESSDCVGQSDFSDCMISAMDGSTSRFDAEMVGFLGDEWRRPDHDSDEARHSWEVSREEAFRGYERSRQGLLSEALFRHADALGRHLDAVKEGRCSALT